MPPLLARPDRFQAFETATLPEDADESGSRLKPFRDLREVYPEGALTQMVRFVKSELRHQLLPEADEETLRHLQASSLREIRRVFNTAPPHPTRREPEDISHIIHTSLIPRLHTDEKGLFRILRLMLTGLSKNAVVSSFPYYLLNLLCEFSHRELKIAPKKADSWGRLASCVDPVTELQFDDKPLLLRRTKPNDFAVYLSRALPLNEIDSAADLGCGPTLADAKFFARSGVKRIDLVDSSESTYGRRQRNASRSKYSKKLNLLSPKTYQDYLRDQKDKSLDLIYSNSSFHYLNVAEFVSIIEETYRVLKPNGHLAFAVKGFDSPYSQQGICLDSYEPDGIAMARTTMNDDGYVRFFRGFEYIKSIISRLKGFKLVRSKQHNVIGYDHGDDETEFYYFVFKRISTGKLDPLMIPELDLQRNSAGTSTRRLEIDFTRVFLK